MLFMIYNLLILATVFLVLIVVLAKFDKQIDNLFNKMRYDYYLIDTNADTDSKKSCLIALTIKQQINYKM